MIISRDWGKEKDASGGVMYRIYGFYIKKNHISPLNFIGTCDCVKGRPLLAYQMPHAVHLAE